MFISILVVNGKNDIETVLSVTWSRIVEKAILLTFRAGAIITIHTLGIIVTVHAFDYFKIYNLARQNNSDIEPILFLIVRRKVLVVVAEIVSDT